MPTGLSSHHGEVLVRFVRSAWYADPVLAAEAKTLLGPEERQLLARLRPEGARLDYLAAHALLRSLIAEVSGCDARRMAIGPRSVAAWGFSISHADGIAICAVAAGCAVGADVESEHNVGRHPRLAEKLCTRSELDALGAMPAPQRRERILALWTLREAMTKAMGGGPASPLGPPQVAAVRLLPHHLATIVVVGARAGQTLSVRFEEHLPQAARAA